MRLRCGSVALATLALSALLPVGCESSNEGNLGGQSSQVAPHKEGTPDFKSYGEAMQHQAQEAAAKKRAGKAKAAPAPKPSPPGAEKEKPKSP
jgi:hypothetical protein